MCRTEVSHVRLDDEVAGLLRADIDFKRRAPFREARASGTVLRAPRGQGIEALHHRRPALTGKSVHLEVRLHAGHDTFVHEQLGECLVGSARLLVERLRVEDGAAQIILAAGRLEEHLPV